MSVRHGLLALLADTPSYGYDLRTQFEHHSGGTWAVNVGQIYITLNRLQRDGLVTATGDADADDERRRQWAITDAGRVELETWLLEPVTRDAKVRDELAMKISLASTHQLADTLEIIDNQRAETLRILRTYTRQKARLAETETAQRLVLDSLIFHAEAEVRWLDHCEQSLSSNKHQPKAAS